ncbi:uncharacterized protein LOC132698347 [Cylas formicarius]|uniref:uncharacterized protein LOC132698347 n=1 Tax=Cylas formicarius TaxID=197179 RepID=UPI002958D7B9|nr:uncharacterized protein LOC132698347 [Cylas formicarius]
MDSLERTWDRSYSDSNLLATFSPMPSPVIIRRTMCVEEIIPNLNCNKIPGFKFSTLNQWHSTSNIHQSDITKHLNDGISSLNLLSDESIVSKNCNSKPFTVENDCVPMEVDSFKETSQDLNDPQNSEDSGIKGNLRLRNLKTDSHPILTNMAIEQRKKHFKNIYFTVLFVIVLVAAFSFCCGYLTNVNIFHGEPRYLNLEKLESELKLKVYLQRSAVNIILKTIDNQTAGEGKVKMLAFIGPPGVGKTFVANILKANFLSKCVHELYNSDLNNKALIQNVLSVINVNCFNLIVVDDLRRPDTDNLVKFVQLIRDDYSVLVISVFSNILVDENFNRIIRADDIIDIAAYLQNFNIDQQVVVFDEFSNDQIEEWIMKQLDLNDVPTKMRPQIIENVMRRHNSKFLGLKSLPSKIFMEIKKN